MRKEGVHDVYETNDALAAALPSYPTANIKASLWIYDNITIPEARRTMPEKVAGVTKERELLQAELDRRGES